jgi:hypothetical protein
MLSALAAVFQLLLKWFLHGLPTLKTEMIS